MRSYYFIGIAEGKDRAKLAVHNALVNPLVEDVNLKKAKKVLVSIGGAHDLTMKEVRYSTDSIGDSIATL
jgi:cell division protein FtsZ